MSVQSGIKALLASALVLSLAACTSKPEEEVPAAPIELNETVKVLVPSGAPAIGLLGAYNQDDIDIEVVEGTDVVTAELAKKDSDYDVIVAPVNLGVKVYEQTQVYKLDGVLTWGNLYMVGEEENQWENADASIAAFGENAVPGLVFKTVLPEAAEKAEYYPSVAEASQALLAGKADAALLAQPAAAAAIAKGKENGKDFQIIGNLQTLWQEKESSDYNGYPQAAVFVREGDEKKADAVIAKVTSFIDSADEESIVKAVDAVGAEKIGAPNAQIVAKTWDAQNICFVDAGAAENDVKNFLKVFGMSLPADMIID